MTKKHNPRDDVTWREKIVAPTEASDLDSDQKRLRSGLGTVLTLVSDAIAKCNTDASDLLGKTENGRFPDDESAQKALRLELERTTLLDALELVHSLVDGTDHPVFRYVEATRSQRVKGRPRRTEREQLQRALLAAFIDESASAARKPADTTRINAALTAASIFNDLAKPSKPISANATRSFFGNGMGHWGVQNYRYYLRELAHIPTEKLEKYTRTAFARLCSAEAVAIVAGKKD